MNEFERKKKEKNKKNLIFFKKGNIYIFLIDKNNNPIIAIGPHWILYIIFISFITLGFLFLFIFYWKFFNSTLIIYGVLVYSIFFIDYTYIFLTDPGIPKIIEENLILKEKNKYMFCRICNNWVSIESQTRHCSMCNICIEGQDHHCSWTSKCIGRKNKYYFYFLIIWIGVIIIYYVNSFLILHGNWLEYKKSEIYLHKN